eukprot:TRINITY_DN4638_c0_g2_i1.p1 TRINITY_DN4638_c0_g2~~TRINITY_DN4638_c0_g2_i1.p1  ORF type:complete len:237 (+),score=37.66 TRINITY_DN4638_c0_g2_i1:259-969(+)
MTSILADIPNQEGEDFFSDDEEKTVDTVVSSSSHGQDTETTAGGHPLENKWTFWYDRRMAPAPHTNAKRAPGERERYESNLRAVGTFATVEDFWRYYNNLHKPSELELDANYHLFKDGIKPMWEDKANENGGKWIIQFREKATLDIFWENLVLALIGETIPSSDDICGCVVSKRPRGDKIAVWNRNKEAADDILALGNFLKYKIGVDPSKLRIEYQTHEDSMKSGLSFANQTKYQL